MGAGGAPYPQELHWRQRGRRRRRGKEEEERKKKKREEEEEAPLVLGLAPPLPLDVDYIANATRLAYKETLIIFAGMSTKNMTSLLKQMVVERKSINLRNQRGSLFIFFVEGFFHYL